MNWFEQSKISNEELNRNLARLPGEIAKMNEGHKVTCDLCFHKTPRELNYILLDVATLEIDLQVADCFKVYGTCQKCSHRQKLNFLADWAWH